MPAPQIAPAITSVRPSAPGPCLAVYEVRKDGLSAKSYPLYAIISIAYDLGYDPRTQASEPDWVKGECYDILIKIDDADLDKFAQLPRPDKGRILQSVLTDRFGMKSHTETRLLPVWALVVAKGGPKLTPATGKSEAGDKLMWKITGDYKLEAKNGSMEKLCSMLLSTEAQEITVDDTHLQGLYDFTISWTRPNEQSTVDAPDIFTAVREQLGLELVKRKISKTVLVVDEIHRPTPN